VIYQEAALVLVWLQLWGLDSTYQTLAIYTKIRILCLAVKTYVHEQSWTTGHKPRKFFCVSCARKKIFARFVVWVCSFNS